MTVQSPGKKRVTAADIARSLGVSRATVGFVLNETPGQTISEATRQRVLAEAERLGYRPHTAARTLASGRSRLVLLVLPEWPMDHNLRTNLEEASLALDKAGYSLVTMTPHAGGKAQPLWETLNPDVVMGMRPFSREQIRQIRAAGVEHVIPDIPEEDAPKLLEPTHGPRLQVEHLAARGRRRLVYAESPDVRVADLVAERSAAAGAACADMSGVELVASTTVNETAARAAVRAWIDDGVDGVVAYNDDVAAVVLGAAVREGIDVPGRLAIIGHDDTPLAHLLVPSLSSVRVDIVGLGRYLAALALNAATGAEPPAAEATAVEATVVVRETT